MNASIERVTSTAASDTYFLGETTAEEFEDMTFAMAESITALHAEVFRSFEGATTVQPFLLEMTKFSGFQPRKVEVFKRTLGALLDQMTELMSGLAKLSWGLSIPFGGKDDGLLPEDANCGILCHIAMESRV